MSSSSQHRETFNIWTLRDLIGEEIKNGIQYFKQSAATRISPPDTASSMILGLDVQILALYCSEETRQGMIEVAKTTPVLLTYAAGKERQEALQAVWQLQKRTKDISNLIARSFYEHHTHMHQHFLTTKVKEMPLGPRGYAQVDYIPCEVVPLVDYWPDFVRKAFALGCWRFAIADAKGCNGLILEIMEGRLDLIEWLIEMEEKRELAMDDPTTARSQDRTRGGIWPLAGTSLGHEEIDLEERSKGREAMEAAQMMKVLRI